MVTAPAKEWKPCAPQCLAEDAAETYPTAKERARRASEIVRRKPERLTA